MARGLRIEYEGAFYHVTSRGNERKAVFRGDRDRERFLSYLASATSRYGARIHAYCLMSNHYHLLLETPNGNLSQIMAHINGAYTTYVNVKGQRAGHLFQGRFRAILVEKEEHALELSRYLHLNPVRARMVATAAAHPWSSFRAYAGLGLPPEWLHWEWLLGQFGESEDVARERYRRFVDAGEQVDSPNPLDAVVGSVVLGSKGFQAWVQAEFLEGRPADRDLPALRQLAERPTMEALRAAAEERFAQDRRAARRVALYLCHRHSGRRLKDIGALFGIKESAVTEASRRLDAEMDRDGELRSAIEELRRDLELWKL
ncbi:MAG: transposase [Deferrisomatales bacterium]